jgi:hypothetical protein
MVLKIETGYIPLYLTKVHLTNVFIILKLLQIPRTWWYCKWACAYTTHRNPGNCTHALHCGQLASRQKLGKSVENQQYYTNRQKQRRWNGSIFLSPNWLRKYPLQTMDSSHHKHSLRICRSKIHTQHHTSWFSQNKDPIHQLENVLLH